MYILSHYDGNWISNFRQWRHSLINQEWKEILLLVLGAFLGSYSRVIDFWFNGNDTDMDGKPDVVAPEPTGPSFCDNCGDQIDYDNF